MSSYHDLHITTEDLPRTSIFNLPYGYSVNCCRVRGWSLALGDRVVAEEYPGPGGGLRLDVDGHVIVDSLTIGCPPGCEWPWDEGTCPTHAKAATDV